MKITGIIDKNTGIRPSPVLNKVSSASAGCSCGPVNAGEARETVNVLPEVNESSRSIFEGTISTPAGPVLRVSTQWGRAERWGEIKCRLSNYRNSYLLPPGLYAAGNPDAQSEVLISANYRLSFDYLRRELDGRNLWILVLDTAGINVWCAAGKGTFGTDELVKRLKLHGVDRIVEHRRLIVPQLGAPGVKAAVVKKKTGFHVHFGPVRSEDLPAYLDGGRKATPAMREVRFGFVDRLVLTPMELLPALKKFPALAGIIFLLMGLMPSGIIFRDAWMQGGPLVLLAFAALIAGAFIAPLFLPFIPFRSFAIKGMISGLALNALLVHGADMLPDGNIYLTALSWLLFPSFSSYLALQFTGATAYTGMSGVERELKAALPLYISCGVLSLVALVLYKIASWGMI